MKLLSILRQFTSPTYEVILKRRSLWWLSHFTTYFTRMINNHCYLSCYLCLPVIFLMLMMTNIEIVNAAEFKIRNCSNQWVYVCVFNGGDSSFSAPFKAEGLSDGDRKKFKCAGSECKIFTINDVSIVAGGITKSVKDHRDSSNTSKDELCKGIVNSDSRIRKKTRHSQTIKPGLNYEKGAKSCQ